MGKQHKMERRDFLKGAGVVGGASVVGMLAGCSTDQPQSNASANTGAPAETATVANPSYHVFGDPQAYPDDYIVKADSEWELVAHVDDGGLIEGLNFDHEGTLWFIDVVKGRIQKVVDGEVITLLDNEGINMPNGAKFINETTMLITDRSAGLCTFDTETNEYNVWFPDFNGDSFNGLNDLVLDGEGGAYFTDPGQSDYFNRIGRVFYVNYEAEDAAIELIQDGLAYPNGITLSPDGQFIYIAEFNTNSIICIPSAAYTAGRITPYVFARMDAGHGPDGITVDADGNIYIARLEAKEVLVLDNNGWTAGVLRMPEDANIFVDNLCLHDGYLYVCEFGSSNIYRIAVNTLPGEK